MNVRLPLTLSLLALACATLLPADARAADSLPYAEEVDSCVAKVNAHIDYENAKRVRHFVSDARSIVNGYAFTIETSVFPRDPAAGPAQRFEAYCVVRGSHQPSTFRITETGA